MSARNKTRQYETSNNKQGSRKIIDVAVNQMLPYMCHRHSHITLQPKTGCPLKLSRVEPGQYLDGRPPGKTRLLLEEVLVRPAGGAHPVVCVGHNAPV